MRIAIVTETWPPEINGVALTVQSLTNGLSELGHSVEVVRPRQPAEASTTDAGIAHQLVRAAAIPRYPGLRFGVPQPGQLSRHWRRCPPDAIYVATEGPLGHSAVTTAVRLGIPVCTGFHTRFDDFVRHYGAGMLAPAVFAWMRWFHNTAAATLVPTSELADWLRSNRFRNVQLLRRAVSTQRFDPIQRDPALRRQWGLADNDLAVIHVGRIAAEKNLAMVTRSFRAIQRHNPRARLVVVGDGPVREHWQAENPDFIFCGIQRDTELARHYASGDLFLFPSLSETFGNVTLEAMASGLAVVAFDYGAAREHIIDGSSGRRIACDDEQGFIDAAVALADDETTRVAMAHAARQAMLPLDPASVSANFAALLAELAQSEAA